MVENVKELLKLHEGITHEVYLDNENSSIVPQEVVDAMLPYFNKKAYGNPTLTHKPGWEAFEVIMNSFQKISKYMGAKNLEEITFTPSETEANNLAIMGSCFAQKSKGKKIVISEIEPINVLQVAEMMGKFGFSTTKIPVNNEGFINLEKLKEAVDKETVLVSISAVNNEIGTIQPIKEAVDIVKAKNPQTLFHTDASDAYGRIPFNVQDLNVDLATVKQLQNSGSKRHGRTVPQGRRKHGTHPRRTNRHTETLARHRKHTANRRLHQSIRTCICRILRQTPPKCERCATSWLTAYSLNSTDLRFNGPKGDKRSPDNANISILRAEGEALTIELSLKGVYVSSGSACSRRLLQPSHVLIAIGRIFEEAHGSILMKVTRSHTEEDIAYVLSVLPTAVNRIRGIVGSTGVH